MTANLIGYSGQKCLMGSRLGVPMGLEVVKDFGSELDNLGCKLPRLGVSRFLKQRSRQAFADFLRHGPAAKRALLP
jgi:hypothetical protein